ncbi:pentapeptide repeat-containing protein [Streptomyces parvus]
MNTPAPPSWQHCAHGADPATDPVGCRGIHAPGHTTCLAHLTDTDRNTYLAGLAPGADIDHRGTTFTEPLLRDLTTALHDSATGAVCFGHARFSSATFEGDAEFETAVFRHDAWFHSAVFKHGAEFHSAVFKHGAGFEAATVRLGAWFSSATFEQADRLGPLVCAGRVVLSGATFGGPVILKFAARNLECRRTRWTATAEIRLRHTTVDFAHAVFEYPLTIAAEPTPSSSPPTQAWKRPGSSPTRR